MGFAYPPEHSQNKMFAVGFDQENNVVTLLFTEVVAVNLVNE